MKDPDDINMETATEAPVKSLIDEDDESERVRAAVSEVASKHPDWKLFQIRISNGDTYIAKLLPYKTIARFGQELDKPNADVAALMGELVRRSVVWPREKVTEEYLNDPNRMKPGHISKIGDGIMQAAGFKDDVEVKAL